MQLTTSFDNNKFLFIPQDAIEFILQGSKSSDDDQVQFGLSRAKYLVVFLLVMIFMNFCLSYSSTTTVTLTPKSKATRKSYTIEVKLEAIRGVAAGKSIRQTGKEMGIDESVVRGWIRNQEKLKSCVGGKKVSVRRSRKVGCGRAALFPELENRLITWIREKNTAGLRVKDKYIELKAKAIRNKLIEEALDSQNSNLNDENRENVKKLEGFLVSSSWLHRFKARFELVSRRHTSSRSLPEGFEQIACNFVAAVQTLINDKKIDQTHHKS